MSIRYVYINGPWHYRAAFCCRSRLAGKLANGRGNCNTDRLKYLTAGSLALSADGKAPVVFLESNLLQGLEILLDVRPLKALARGLNAPVELLNGDYIGNLRMAIVVAPLQNLELLGQLK